MVEKLYPTYEDIHKEVTLYGASIIENGIKFDQIVALTRGGSLIGTILSHQLNLPIKYVKYSAESGKGETTDDNDILPEFGDVNINLLIVDDICDTGYTFFEVIRFYERRGYQRLVTYSVFNRYENHPIHYPNYSISIVDDTWICYPWEVTGVV